MSAIAISIPRPTNLPNGSGTRIRMIPMGIAAKKVRDMIRLALSACPIRRRFTFRTSAAAKGPKKNPIFPDTDGLYGGFCTRSATDGGPR